MKSALHFLSHDKKLSCNQGELIPVGLLEVLPGDKIDHAISALVRTSPLVTPVMHECEVKFHSWFVPTRLIWDEWEDFITGGEDGLQAPVAPTIAAPTGGWLIGSLGDYLGLPTGVQYSTATSALPFRAYQLIYNNWYRDEQLQTPATFSTASGVDVTTSRSLQNGCWDKDRFTSARPQPQLGAEVVIPLTGDAPIKGDATRSAAGTTGSFSVLDVNNAVSDLATDGALAYPKNTAVGTGHPLYADHSQVSAVDVEDLREASAMQRFLENMNNFGSRYIERLQSAFGVNPQDGRLQLPEYLGGGTQKIQFSEVLQTAEGTDPVGEMKGHGISAQRTNRYRRYIP